MVRQKKCKVCFEKFTPRYSSLQCTCFNHLCVIEWNKKVQQKKSDKVKKEKLLGLQPLKYWIGLAQIACNTYIRVRDKGKQCISCDKTKYTVHAGHCFPTSTSPSIRFNENNIHNQCDECNIHLHGNGANYIIRLEKRIGKEAIEELLRLKEIPVHYTIQDLKELTMYFKEKTKALK